MQTEATEEIFMPQNFIVIFGRKTRYNIELNAVQRKELCIKMFNVVQKREIYENISLIFTYLAKTIVLKSEFVVHGNDC